MASNNSEPEILASDPKCMDFVACLIVGYIAKVHTSDGHVIEGVVHSFSTSKSKVVLNCCILLQKGSTDLSRKRSVTRRNGSKPQENSEFLPGSNVVLNFNDIAMLLVQNVNPNPLDYKLPVQPTKAQFQTDSAISSTSSQTMQRERKFEKWVSTEDETNLETLEDGLNEKKKSRKWDQFQTNREKFGVVAHFSEELYTTTIDRTADGYKEREREAARIASEIEASVSANVHLAEERNLITPNDVDNEEMRYSAVIKTPQATGTTSPQSLGLKSHGQKVSIGRNSFSRRNSLVAQMPSNREESARVVELGKILETSQRPSKRPEQLNRHENTRAEQLNRHENTRAEQLNRHENTRAEPLNRHENTRPEQLNRHENTRSEQVRQDPIRPNFIENMPNLVNIRKIAESKNSESHEAFRKKTKEEFQEFQRIMSEKMPNIGHEVAKKPQKQINLEAPEFVPSTVQSKPPSFFVFAPEKLKPIDPLSMFPIPKDFRRNESWKTESNKDSTTIITSQSAVPEANLMPPYTFVLAPGYHVAPPHIIPQTEQEPQYCYLIAPVLMQPGSQNQEYYYPQAPPGLTHMIMRPGEYQQNEEGMPVPVYATYYPGMMPPPYQYAPVNAFDRSNQGRVEK